MPATSKGNTNRQLTAARKAKKDEFYTTKQIVEDELHWYQNDFRNRPVLCNCNDWPNSEFVKYFMRKMASLNIPKLIAVGYENTVGTLFEEGHGTLYELVNDGRPADQPYTMEDFKTTKLEGSGGFETPECEKLLDIPNVIVCTNPPFSRIKSFLPMLDRHNVGFLVLANINAITYKECFSLIMNERCWLGVNNGNMWFRVPDDYESNGDNDKRFRVDEDGGHWRSIGNACWFTNLNGGRIGKNELSLEGNRYDPMKYPKYDDYDAINVDRVQEIPEDYFGEMGVPVTFLTKWAPEPAESVTERERERERERENGFDSVCSDTSAVIRRTDTVWRDPCTFEEQRSSSVSSSDVPSRRRTPSWDGRALGQEQADSNGTREIRPLPHPTFRLLGIANSARWIGRECLTIINGRRVYNRLIVQRTEQL